MKTAIVNLATIVTGDWRDPPRQLLDEHSLRKEGVQIPERSLWNDGHSFRFLGGFKFFQTPEGALAPSAVDELSQPGRNDPEHAELSQRQVNDTLLNRVNGSHRVRGSCRITRVHLRLWETD